MSRIDDAVTAHSAREVRHGADGPEPLAAGRPQPAEELRLARASRGGAPGGARVAGAAEERGQGCCRCRRSAPRIHVAGKNADDIGNQCGGWTIDWQGKSGDVTTGGTTILAAIKNAVSKDTKVTFSKDGTGAAGATVGVVVIGETPYAEMKGDRADLALAPEDVAAVQDDEGGGHSGGRGSGVRTPADSRRRAGSGRRLVAAWLPGTEGQGVADVLFGDYKPTGKLSFTWPRKRRAGYRRAAIRLRLRPEVLSLVGQVGNLRTDWQSVQASPARLITERWKH